MRIMGLDYGSKTIGVAVSDPLGWTAQGIETITRQDPGNLIASLQRLKELVDAYEVECVVVGMPLNMDNTSGERVDRTTYFIKRLQKTLSVSVDTMDERLSTMSAERILIEGGVRRENRKEHIDKIAATLILQTYLDKRSNQQAEHNRTVENNK